MHPLDIVFQILLVFAPQVGYVAQYFEIVSTNSIEGYAPLVSLILLSSNTLRLYYFIGDQYMLALFFQAIVGVLVHFALLLKVLDVHVSQVVSEHQEDVLFGNAGGPLSPISAAMNVEEAGGKPSPAVQGTPASSAAPTAPQRGDTVIAEEEGGSTSSSPIVATFFRFLRFLFAVEDSIEKRLLRLTPLNFALTFVMYAAVALVVVVVYILSIGRVWHGSIALVGYVSLGIEALLVVPQILRNARRRSTEGLSIILILSWAGGDIVKVIYYIYKHQALPFIVCGIFQTLLDVVVVAQVIYYRFYLRSDSNNAADEGAGAAEPASPSIL